MIADHVVGRKRKDDELSQATGWERAWDVGINWQATEHTTMKSMYGGLQCSAAPARQERWRN